MARTGFMMTLGVFAAGAGALVAAALVPVFSPYRDKPDRPAQGRLVLGTDDADELVWRRDRGPTADWQRREPDDDDGLRMAYRDGEMTVDVPRWVEDGGAWLALGRRAWRDWVEPGEDEAAGNREQRDRYDANRGGYGRDEDAAQPRYAFRQRHGWDEGERGYRRSSPRSDRDWDDRNRDNSRAGGEDYDEAGEEPRWSAPYAPSPRDMADAPLGRLADEQPSRLASPARRTSLLPPAAASDAAAGAAQRAQAAARDVSAAEKAVQ